MFDMFAFIKSRVVNNIIIFILWMWLAYSFSSFFWNNWFTTANIWDAFSPTQQSSKDYDISVTNDGDSYIIKSLKEFEQSQWRSLRIWIIYNKDIKQQLISSFQSKLKFSVWESSGDNLIILIDLWKQTIPYWTNILEISLDDINGKDIPIIHSITLYDEDIINNLSIDYDHTSEYH